MWRQLERLLWPSWYAACFTNSCHNSSVWGNYGDSHKGVCLIFDNSETNIGKGLSLRRHVGWRPTDNGDLEERWGGASPIGFDTVSYSDKPNEIDFFRNIGRLPLPALMTLWYTDEAGNVSQLADHLSRETWRRGYWQDFRHDITLKSKDWEYEQECRLILNGLLEDSLDDHRRTLTYDFSSLKGIIFGIRTSDEDKVKTLEVIERKCREHGRTEFKFYQAYYSSEHGDIRKYEMKFEFTETGDTDGRGTS